MTLPVASSHGDAKKINSAIDNPGFLYILITWYKRLNLIISGDADQMAVTIMDIAKASGKSYPTVSRAMNNHPKISEKTKQEIRAVAARLGYRPSFAGTALKKGRTSTFSIIVPDLADPFYADFINHFKRLAAEKKFDTVIYDYELNPELERRYLERMLTGCSDGSVAFITSFLHTHDLVEALWTARIPLTAIGTPHEFAGTAKYDWCTVDTSQSLLKILKHLKLQGRKHFVQLLPPQPEDIRTLILKNLRHFLETAGFPFSSHSIYPLCARSTDQAQAGLTAGLELIRTYPEVDVIYALNGFQAYGVLLAAHQCGRKIPEDIAIIVNDNTWISRYSITPLHRIDQCLDQLAFQAFMNLFSRCTSAEWEPQRRFIIESKAILATDLENPEKKQETGISRIKGTKKTSGSPPEKDISTK